MTALTGQVVEGPGGGWRVWVPACSPLYFFVSEREEATGLRGLALASSCLWVG